jgi:polysaccharide export outer membrane protein
MIAAIVAFVLAFGIAEASAQTPVTRPGKTPVAQAPAPPAQTVSSDGPAATDYLVGPQDVLQITVYGEPQLSGLVHVDNDGTIPFQYLQRVKAENLTVAQIGELLRKGLADGYIRNPQVEVQVEQYHSQNVYVLGEVKAAGKYSLPGNSTLVDVLTQAGSTLPTAGHWVLINHHKEGSALTGPVMTGATGDADLKINLNDIQSGKAHTIQIHDGDTIFVPKAERIFVNGNVRTPGAYPFDDGMTVFEAIGIAGGVSEKGSSSRLSIKRLIDGQLKEVGVKPTDLLKPGDQIFVKARRL